MVFANYSKSFNITAIISQCALQRVFCDDIKASCIHKPLFPSAPTLPPTYEQILTPKSKCIKLIITVLQSTLKLGTLLARHSKIT